MENNKLLHQLLKNVSNDGMLAQMLRDEFLEGVSKDIETSKYILEHCNPRHKTIELLKKYRENSLVQDYEFEKGLIIRYLEVQKEQMYQCDNIIEIIPASHIIEDKEFIEKVILLSSSSEYLFSKNKELTQLIFNNDWYIEKLIDANKFILSSFPNFDYSDMDRTLRVLNNEQNYESLRGDLKTNPIIINHLLDLVEKKDKDDSWRNRTSKLKLLESMAENIEFQSKNEIISPENLKSTFIHFGIFFKDFKYTDQENAETVRNRVELIKADISKNDTPDILVKLTGNKEKFGLLFGYQVLTEYKNILESLELKKYYISTPDMKLLKTMMKQVCSTNPSLKSEYQKLIDNGLDISTTKHTKSHATEVCQDVIKNMYPLILERVLEIEAPINKKSQIMPMKF